MKEIEGNVGINQRGGFVGWVKKGEEGALL